MARAGSPWQLPVRMTSLLDEIDLLETSGDPGTVEVSGIEHDSRRVAPGDLFCCLVGRRDDGHDHAGEAVARGAVGLVCERAISSSLPAPVVRVRVRPGEGRRAMAQLAAALWGHPSDGLLTAGVTGTNGKTTVTHLVGAVLAHAGHSTTVIGTLTGARTTPEAPELQRILARVRDAAPAGGARPAVAMEVSSHALVQARVDGVRFDVAAFTNLSHDHLDFHGTMEEYFAAKASLFTQARAGRAVIDVDGPWGARLFEQVEIDAVPVRLADLAGVRLEAGRSELMWRGLRVTVPLTGLVNVRNAHLAAETAVALGVDPETVAGGLGRAAPVPGRLERVLGPPGVPTPEVFVDYAHTPAALESVLEEARRLAAPGSGRTIVVFGCGGDRDASKRPLMGAVAGRMADMVVVTSDNPRSEDPGAIIAAAAAGVPARVPSVVEPDRRAAICRAVAQGRPGDVVVVAGKGHETYQEVDGRRLPFDDRAVVAAALAGAGTDPGTGAEG